MKLVVTVSDAAHLVNAGGELERTSAIIDIGNDLPLILKQYMGCKPHYLSVSFSILDETPPETEANNG
jgi:hypothetical protein